MAPRIPVIYAAVEINKDSLINIEGNMYVLKIPGLGERLKREMD